MSIEVNETYTARRVDKLRLIADFLEEHHDFLESLSHDANVDFNTWGNGEVTIHFYTPWVKDDEPDRDALVAKNAQVVKRRVRAAMRHFGGKWDKDMSSMSARFTQSLPSGLGLELSSDRETICKKKVVGVEEVEVVDHANAPKIMIEKEIIEWECGSILS